MRAPSRRLAARSPPGRSSAATSYSSRYWPIRASTSASDDSLTTLTRSPTPQVLIEKPSRRWASTLSPSVTATSRMLSPKRAILPRCQSAFAHAARVQVPISSWTGASPQWPTTTLRSSRRRAAMNPNSRSPWAAWFRFMKSMSMSAQGISRLNCVCRCRNGLSSASRPAIHILAGLNVCIQVIRPDAGRVRVRLAARAPGCRPSRSATGLVTTRTGIAGASSRAAAIAGRVLGDLLERLRAVEVLAAGDEPDLGCRKVEHVESPWVAARRVSAGRRHSCSGRGAWRRCQPGSRPGYPAGAP